MAYAEIKAKIEALSSLVEETDTLFEAGKTESPHGEVLSEMSKQRLAIYEALDDAVPNWEQKECRARIAKQVKSLKARMAELELKLRDADAKARKERHPERKETKERVFRKVKVNKHKFKTAHEAHHAYYYANSMVVNLMDGRHSDKLIIAKVKDLLEIALSLDEDRVDELAQDGSLPSADTFAHFWKQMLIGARRIAASTTKSEWLDYAQGIFASAYYRVP